MSFPGPYLDNGHHHQSVVNVGNRIRRHRIAISTDLELATVLVLLLDLADQKSKSLAGSYESDQCI